MLKNTDKTKLYLAVGLAAGYYIGRRYDVQLGFKLQKAAK